MVEEITYRGTDDEQREEIGTLFLVATPLGNREDISPRAVKILEQVDYVAAEDTRTAAMLLSELGIGNRLISYYEQNQRERHETFLRDLLAGRSIAVISEAGMPCISDPGEGIVRLAVQHGIPITVIPGHRLLFLPSRRPASIRDDLSTKVSSPREEVNEENLLKRSRWSAVLSSL